MIRPRVVTDAAVDEVVGIASSFATELPYRPLRAMFVVKELNKLVEGVAVGALRVCLGGAGTVTGKTAVWGQPSTSEVYLWAVEWHADAYVATMSSVT